MIGIFALAVAAVIAGAVGGGLAVVSLGIRREKQASSLASDISDRVGRAARRLNGLYTRGSGLAGETNHPR